MRRGQAAVEFLVLTGFMVLVFTTFFLVVQERAAVQEERSRYNEIIAIAEVIETEVALANSVRIGYNRSFELPEKVAEQDYTILLYPATEDPSEVVIRTPEQEYVLFLSVNISLGSALVPGFNNIVKTQYDNITITPGRPVSCTGEGESCGTDMIYDSFCDCVCEDEDAMLCDDACVIPGVTSHPDVTGAVYDTSCGPDCGSETLCPVQSACRDLQSDPDNCGTCGYLCDPGDFCVDGGCSACGNPGMTNIIYRAGTGGNLWNNITGADSRDALPTVNPSLCCDEATQCVWTASSGSCRNLGYWNAARWICDDTGLGAEMLLCTAAQNGDVYRASTGENYCCSIETSGGRAGEYLFGPMTGLSTKVEAAGVVYGAGIEACADGSDNDCDGLLDEDDPDCWGASVVIGSVCTLGGFTSGDDLRADAVVSGLTNDVQIEYDWRINGQSIALRNYNFDVNHASYPGGTARDYSTNNAPGTINGAKYANQGHSHVTSGGYNFGTGSAGGSSDNDNIIMGSKYTTYNGDFAYEAWVAPYESTFTNGGAQASPPISEFTGSNCIVGTNPSLEYVLYPDFLTGSLGCPASVTNNRVGVGFAVGMDGVIVTEHGGGYMPATLVYQTSLSGWHHIVINYINRIPHLYLDGNLVRTGVAGKHLPVPSRRLGGEGPSYGWFTGRLNSFRTYDRALSEDQIQYLSNPASAETRNFLAYGETNAGDTVQVCVTANNRTHELNTVCSNAVTITTGPSACQTCPPATATGLTGVQTSPTTLRVTWNPASGTEGQMLTVGTNQADVASGCPGGVGANGCVYDNSLSNMLSPTTSLVDIPNLQRGVTYYFKVASIQQACGGSNWYSNTPVTSYSMCSGC